MKCIETLSVASGVTQIVGHFKEIGSIEMERILVSIENTLTMSDKPSDQDSSLEDETRMNEDRHFPNPFGDTPHEEESDDDFSKLAKYTITKKIEMEETHEEPVHRDNLPGDETNAVSKGQGTSFQTLVPLRRISRQCIFQHQETERVERSTQSDRRPRIIRIRKQHAHDVSNVDKEFLNVLRIAKITHDEILEDKERIVDIPNVHVECVLALMHEACKIVEDIFKHATRFSDSKTIGKSGMPKGEHGYKIRTLS